MPSHRAWTASGAIGFGLRSVRGLREKIWIASHPMYFPAFAASANPPAIETCAPRSMDSFAELRCLGKRVRRGGGAGGGGFGVICGSVFKAGAIFRYPPAH